MPRTTDATDVLASLLPRILLGKIGSVPDAIAGRPFSCSATVAALALELSGFVPLVERLARRSALDELSSLIHTSLSELLGLIEEHGGDVVAFDGTTALAVWSAEEGDLAEALLAPGFSGTRIQEWLHDRPVFPGVRLTLRIGLASGPATLHGLGGEEGRSIVTLLGPAVADAMAARRAARPGELLVAPDAWGAIAAVATGDLRQDGHVRLRELRRRPAPRAPRRPRLPEGGSAALLAFVPEPLRAVAEGRGSQPGEILRLTHLACRVPAAAGDGALGDAVATLQRRLAPRGVVLSVDGGATDRIVRAVFGLHGSREEDAPVALAAAVAVEEELAARGLKVGIGVATARAFSGPATGTFRRQHALISRATLAAGALCQADAVLGDEATMRRSRGRIVFAGSAMGPSEGMPQEEEVDVAGPQGEVTGYRPLTLLAPPTAATPLRGRDALLEAVGKAVANLGIHGSAGVLVLEGEPGSGRSRLLAKIGALAVRSGMIFLPGSPRDSSAVFPYGALRRPLRILFDVDEALEQSPWKSRVLPVVEREPRWRRLAPLLAPLLGLDEEDNDITCQMKGAARAEATSDLLLGLLKDAAARRPLVIAMDDVVDADSMSLAILAKVAREVPRTLLALALPAGGLPSRLEELLVAGRVERHVLAPLPEDAVAAVAADVLGEAPLTPAAVAQICRAARGNPLLATLAARILRDEGEGAGAGKDALPATIEGLVARRAAALAPARRRTLETVALLGSADADVVAATCPDVSLESLGALARDGMVEIRASEPELVYAMTSPVIARAVLAAMTAPELAALAASGAAAWDARGKGAECDAAIAGLLARAGRPEQALPFIEDAAAGYLEQGASREALDLLSQGARLARDLADPEERARWERLLGEAHLAVGERELARAHLTDAVLALGVDAGGMSVAEQLLTQIWRRIHGSHDPLPPTLGAAGATEAARASRMLSRLAWEERRAGAGLRHALAAVHFSEAAPDGPERSLAYAAMTRAASLVPLAAIADAYAARARRSARDLRDLPALATVLHETSLHGLGRGDFVHVDADLALAAEIAEGLRDRGLEEDGLLLRAHAATAQARFRDGLVLWCLVGKHALERGDELRHGWGTVGQAACLLALGRNEDAARLADSARRLGAVGRDPESRRAASGVAARAALRVSGPAACRELLRDALQASADDGPETYAALLGYAVTADAALDLAGGEVDDLPLAEEACRGLRRFALRFPIGRPRSLVAEGRRALLHDSSALAERRFSAARAAATELGLSYEEALATLGLALLMPPKDPLRRAELERSWRTLAAIGADPDLADVRAAMENA